MYVIELNNPGWMVCALFLNNHITAPHDNAAKMEKYRESGGSGLPVLAEVAVDVEYGYFDLGMNEATTRETT